MNESLYQKIFLVGMMGSGKTYWSRQLANKLKCGAYDLDSIIELHEEKSITEIFDEDGENYFRKKEAELLRWFAEKKSFVIATGGGTPCFHNNMEWMNKEGITIWLNEPIDVLVERLKNEKSKRPLISNQTTESLKTFLENKLAEREYFYSLAKFQLRNDDITLKKMMEIISNKK